MFLSLLATLAVLGQAPASSEAPLSIVLAPTEAPGVPSSVISFVEEHVDERLKTQGLQVINAAEFAQSLPGDERKRVLGCSLREAPCRITLGEAAQADVVLVAELVQFLSGYRVALKAYGTRDGELISEYYVPGVHEDQVLDAFTLALDKVMLPVRRVLRPQSVAAGPPTPNPTRPPETHPSTTTPPPTTAVKPPPPPRKQYRSLAPGWSWVPAVGGVVLGGVGAFFYVQANQDYVKLTDPNQVYDSKQAQALVTSGNRSQWIGTIAVGVGAAGVVTTGLLYLLSGSVEVTPGVKPTVSLAPSGAMIGVTGALP